MAHTLRHALVPLLFMVAGTAVAGPAADHAQTLRFDHQISPGRQSVTSLAWILSS